MKRFKVWLGLVAIVMAMPVLMGCSSDDSDAMDNQNAKTLVSGDVVTLFRSDRGEVKAVYDPISYDDAPLWLKPFVAAAAAEKSGPYVVAQGQWNGMTVYNRWTASMSLLFGEFVDEDGERLPTEVQSIYFYYEASDWKVVVYNMKVN